MGIIANKAHKNNVKQGFWLRFRVNDPSVFIPAGLPEPTLIEYLHGFNTLSWLIDGFFGTKRGQEYLTDTIAGIMLALNFSGEKWAERLPYAPNLDKDPALQRYTAKIYRLKELSRSLPPRPNRRHAPQRADSFDDYRFWAIKLWVEDEIRATGGPVVYERLEAWALAQFADKERSTIRAKCRSVWAWYEKRSWKIWEGRKFTMSRTEAAAAARAARTEQGKRRVISVMTGLMAGEYKKKNGKWNIAKMARELKMHRDTVAKYVREWEEQN
jgi:hypothetical protein